MPELPEAETIARGLHERIAGRRIERVRVHRPELVEPLAPRRFERTLAGRRVEAVGRRAKWVTVRLDDGHRWVTQLRMTGTFTWAPGEPDPVETDPAEAGDRHLSLTVWFDGPGDGRLRFHDIRRFGRMRVLDPEAWARLDERIGPEPLDREFTADELAHRIGGSRAPVRNALLDQARVAGIGNVYANEACFEARIAPDRSAASLSRPEIERLHGAIRRLLERAIERRGTSFSDYRDVGGGSGEFQQELAVYGRAGEPCSTCGAPIRRITLAGRSAFFCPSCQAPGERDARRSAG